MAIDINGNTALVHAIKNVKLEAVQLILEKAPIDIMKIKNKDNQLPIDIFITLANEVKSLLKLMEIGTLLSVTDRIKRAEVAQEQLNKLQNLK